jgi:hypothetical protein
LYGNYNFWSHDLCKKREKTPKIIFISVKTFQVFGLHPFYGMLAYHYGFGTNIRTYFSVITELPAVVGANVKFIGSLGIYSFGLSQM